MTRKAKNVVREVNKYLEGELVDLLADEAVRGAKNNSNACPIATYVQRESGDAGVKVGRVAVTTGDGQEIPLSSEARKFVNHFDSGYYPNLEKKW